MMELFIYFQNNLILSNNMTWKGKVHIVFMYLSAFVGVIIRVKLPIQLSKCDMTSVWY